MSGKTTIGKALSKKMKFKFNDLDDLIEAKHKQSIITIFKERGEERFRIYEKQCLEDFLEKDKHILSVGGGTINCKTLEMSRSFKYRIWLYASIDTLIKRHSEEAKNRPLLYNTNNIEIILTELYDIRKDFYKNCSNIVIDSNDKTIGQIIDESITKINELD